jgi:hypothetical protein
LPYGEYLDSDFAPQDQESDEKVFGPNGPWATVTGQCIFTVEVTETFPGTEVELTTVTNSEESTDKFLSEVVGEYQTGGFKWIITSDVLDLSMYDVLEIFEYYSIPDSVNMDNWRIDSFLAKITGQPTVIPPCTVLTMNFTPSIRSVILRPIFHIISYEQDISGTLNKLVSATKVKTFTNWRDWGGVWQEIYNDRYWINGMSELITGGPSPLPQSVAGAVDYYYERLQQCP